MKSRNYEFRYNDKSHYYNRLCYDAVTEASIEESHYYTVTKSLVITMGFVLFETYRNYKISLI